MENNNLLLLLVSIFCSCMVHGQNDSIVVHRYSDTYIEINVLGRQWDETSSDERSSSSQIADGIYMQRFGKKNKKNNAALIIVQRYLFKK